MHGDADLFVGGGHPFGAQAELFRANDDGDGAGHVQGGVEFGGVGRGGDGAYALPAEPGNGFRRAGFGQRNGEEGADAGADDVGVVDVRAAVADNQRICSGGIGGAQHGAEVAGFFDVFGHDDEWAGGQAEVGEGAADLRAEGEESFGAVAVSDFSEDGRGAFNELGSFFGATGDERGFVFALVEFGAIKELEDGDLVVEGAFDFAVAFDNQQRVFVPVGPLAQFDDFLDAGVLQAADQLRAGGHGV